VIGRLSGKLAGKQPPQVLVDVGGVAYELDVPMSTFYNLPATGAEVALYTHLVVREDAHQLYGFASEVDVVVKMLGLGMATAIFLDATVVRMAIGPALLKLGGRWNWWPGKGYQLVRSVPNIQILNSMEG